MAERRNAIDHCRFFSDEQARRAMKLGIVMNCNTSYIQGGDKGEIGAIAAIYGKAQADDIVVPMRRLIDVGLRPGTEIAGDTFGILETLVTRKDTEGKVWGPQQKISRREALLTITRWNARYTLREDRIGSIERGKLADLTVLDRDFLTVPEDDISEVKVLMTILAGKPTYIAASFAPAEGLPVVGYQGPKRGGGGGD
ncbi:MAG: amidohydrolase family protein [Acidobacteria bacterium]|nr:amidohydrolase family protein [Acidobacteriota bacterium]